MDWSPRILGEELNPWLSDSPANPSVLAQVTALLAQQQATWPVLREAVAALARIESRHFSVKGAPVIAQFNPGRIVSVAAKVDAGSIRARPCFLCPDNLPAEEKGVAFGSEFVILCNPFPVLKNHLVITHRDHTPHAIAGQFGSLLDLAAALGPDYFALYNGPQCGASAPDHLHFQACDRTVLPLFPDLRRHPHQSIGKTPGIEVLTLSDYYLNVLVARGTSPQALMDWFAQTDSAFTIISAAPSEPMLNLVVTYESGTFTVCVFPRSRHRPACYFAEGEQKLTISPGAIDLAGVMVVPEPDHFRRITAPQIEEIYAEVTLDPLRFDQLLKHAAPGSS